jgi:5-formyltetrahydrofolate cyclo-ligase
MELIKRKQKKIFVPLVEGIQIAFYLVNDNPSFPGVDNSASLQAADFPAMVITPGLAFDRSLYRMGRGGGHYDRFYAALDADGRQYTAIGLCLDCQLVDKVPVCPHDKKMDMLLTEKGG